MTPLLGAKTLTVERPGAQVETLGIMSDGTPTSFTIRASVQPANGRERENLPEGYRTRTRLKMYVDSNSSPLQTTNLVTQQREDIVLYRGSRFEVLSETDFIDFSVPTAHIKYFLAKISKDDPS